MQVGLIFAGVLGHAGDGHPAAAMGWVIAAGVTVDGQQHLIDVVVDLI